MLKVKRLLLFAVSYSLLSLLPAVGYCSSTTTVSNETMVTMSLRQYEVLKTSIETLKENSMKREELIKQQKEQIETLREQLTVSQTQIQNSQSSMNQTQQLLTQQKASLETLTQQINEQSHKYRVAKRQRDTWAVAAGMLLVGLAAK
nr:MAG TPA: Peptidoglycan endopeptidase [Caudoviricetes sp.]